MPGDVRGEEDKRSLRVLAKAHSLFPVNLPGTEGRLVSQWGRVLTTDLVGVKGGCRVHPERVNGYMPGRARRWGKSAASTETCTGRCVHSQAVDHKRRGAKNLPPPERRRGMDQPMCDKCYLPLVAVKAKVVRGLPVVTVKCVGCGLKKDIGTNMSLGRHRDPVEEE